MSGLKTYLPILARHLSTTVDFLYERQKRLTRAGLLSGSPGRGPGSGIRVTPRIIATMVMARLATDDLTEIEGFVEMLALKRSDSGACPLTDAKTFGEALSLLLASEGFASRVVAVVVRRADLHAEITFKSRVKGKSTFESSSFGRELPRDTYRQQFVIEARLPGTVVQTIARDLTAVLSGKPLRALEKES